MEFSKKNLLSLVKQVIKEAPMIFDTPDRPDAGIQARLRSGETPMTKIPFPETGDEPGLNFQELLASERYRQVVAKVREYTGLQAPLRGQESMAPLTQMMLQAYQEINAIEANHKEELTQLAIELVNKEMNLPEDAVQFDAEIVGMGEIDTSDFVRDDEDEEEIDEPSDIEGDDEEFGNNEPEDNEKSEEEIEPIDIETDLMFDLETLNLERAKRRFINSIVQGASKRGHYMYHFVEDRIRQITGSDRLINQYGVLMSINDTLYWQLSDDTMKIAMGSAGAPRSEQYDEPEDDEEFDTERPEGEDDEFDDEPEQQPQQRRPGQPDGTGNDFVGGKVFVNRDTEPPTIQAKGVNFPILVHELIKGVMELFSHHGEGEDKELFKQAMKMEDTLDKETWDVRLGPAIWDRIRQQFPEEILTDESKGELQNYLLVEIFKLPAKKFLVLMKEVISGSPEGKRLLNELMVSITQMLNNQEYEDALDRFRGDLDNTTNKTDDDNLDDFLSQFNIRRPDQ